jgi:CubicO group peptidase (beta-lactamase class C family)
LNVGSFTYAKAFGFKSLEEGQERPLEKDAVMALASCTKLVTTIAALQCVERGLVGLDDDVAGTLPELARQEILTGMDPALGTPILKRRKNLITLR